jgi:hypothetical protein
MEKNCIILDIELNDLKIAQLCMGLNVLTERWSRSKFIEFFQKFLNFYLRLLVNIDS